MLVEQFDEKMKRRSLEGKVDRRPLSPPLRHGRTPEGARAQRLTAFKSASGIAGRRHSSCDIQSWERLVLQTDPSSSYPNFGGTSRDPRDSKETRRRYG